MHKYLTKMLMNHGWSLITSSSSTRLPLQTDSNYITSLETTNRPTTTDEQEKLKQEFFNSCQVIGELIYPMCKCQLDISSVIIKLSQYMENLARQHYLALLQVAQYVAATVHNGIYYWRTEAQMVLPFAPLPVAHSDNHHFSDSVLSSLHSSNLVAFVDSDWGTDKSHQ